MCPAHVGSIHAIDMCAASMSFTVPAAAWPLCCALLLQYNLLFQNGMKWRSPDVEDIIL